MIEIIPAHLYPDDDGERTRPWIVDGDERCRNGVSRVIEIMNTRPWVSDKVVEVPKDCEEDMAGIDLFVPVNQKLLKFLDIASFDQGVPFQVKSSIVTTKYFAKKHEIYDKGEYCFLDKLYFFVLNGTDAKDMIVTDVMGQIVSLAKRNKISESTTLSFMLCEMIDDEMVEVYLANKMILKEFAWYLKK